jgi:hypothetical protein
MTRATDIIRAAFGGALLANAVPHGVNGISGRPFPTPFADPPGVGLSDPWTNVAWSSVNAVAGALLLRGLPRTIGVALAMGAGAAATAISLAWFFGTEH